MNKTVPCLRRLVCALAALTLLCGVFRSLAFATAFDRAVGYFDGNIFSTLLYIGLAAAILLCLAYLIWARRAQKKEAGYSLPCPDPTDHSLTVRLACLPVVACYLILVIVEVPAAVRDGIFSFALLRLVAALCAIPYFLSLPQRNTGLSGMCTPLYGILVLIVEYFDHYTAMNSPLKLMQQLACFAVMLYLVTELYALAGKPSPHRAVLFGSLAMLLGLSNGISCAVAALLGDIIPTGYLLRALLLASIGLYAAVRLFTASSTSTTRSTTKKGD